jgi:hypothetical protein
MLRKKVRLASAQFKANRLFAGCAEQALYDRRSQRPGKLKNLLKSPPKNGVLALPLQTARTNLIYPNAESEENYFRQLARQALASV